MNNILSSRQDEPMSRAETSGAHPAPPAPADAPVARLTNLSVTYPTDAGQLHAISSLSLDVGRGEVLGIVGESGSGKTTVASALLGLLPPEVCTGRVEILGTDVLTATRKKMTELRRHHVAAIRQDPQGSLNPVRRVASQLAESARLALRRRGSAAREAVHQALVDVGLRPSEVLNKYPHQLSGGMNQRVAIAMALLKDPQIFVADEPTSALDVRTQAAVVRLLLNIRRERGTALVIVTHDLELALRGCDRVAVMYAGRLVEVGRAKELRQTARHPYTRALLASSPQFGADTRAEPIRGRFTSVIGDDPGCPFRSRCLRVQDRCHQEFPPVDEHGAARTWCWNPDLQATAAPPRRSA